MIDLKEWLEFKLATAEEVIEVEVKIWLEQYNKINELQPLISEFGKWKDNKTDAVKQTTQEKESVIPSSPAYKVGDKVEVIKRHKDNSLELASVLEYKETDDTTGWHWCITKSGYGEWFSNDCIKPYTPEDDLIQQQKEWLVDCTNYAKDRDIVCEHNDYKVGDEIMSPANGFYYKIKAITKEKDTNYHKIWIDSVSKSYIASIPTKQ